MLNLDTLRSRSIDLLATLQSNESTAPDREAACEALFALPGGFWQRSDTTRYETLSGFLHRVSVRAVRILEGKGVRPGSVDPADLAQDVLLVFLKSAHTISTPNGRWFVTVAARRAMKMLRDEGLYLDATGEIDLDRTPAQPSNGIDRRGATVAARTSAMRSAVTRLPAGVRAVVELQLQGYSSSAVGRQLGLKPATVRQRTRRARFQLQRLLAS